nr:hypothetical protein [Tanacetum cinerariifolium]
MDEGTKNYSFAYILAGSNPSVLVDKTKYFRDGLKTSHTTSSENEESRADDISQKVKLEDLANILKDTRFAFFTSDFLTNELIIVSDVSEEEENAKNDKDTKDTSSQKKELEQAKVIAEGEVTSMKAKPSYPDINQLTKLLHIKDMEIELPGDLKEIPSKLETFTSTISNLLSQLETLDSLPGLLKMITNTLNRFATLVENTSGATTTGVTSADKATASLAEGEKDADTNLKNELVDLLGIDIITQYYNKKYIGKIGQLKSLKISMPVTYSWLNEESSSGPQKIGKYLHFSVCSGTETEEGPWLELQFSLVDNFKLNVVYLLNRS